MGIRPAAWASGNVVEVDMTGAALARPERISARIQLSTSEASAPFTQEPAYAQTAFTASDPKIIVRPREGYTGGVESVIVHGTQANQYGAYAFSTGITTLPGPDARPAAPTDIPTAALFSHYTPVPRTTPAGGVPTTILDARESTGTSLRYSWDLDGDGSFGDDPNSATAGTATIPFDTLFRNAVTGSIDVGVRVTSPGGGESTKRLTLPLTAAGSGEGYAFRAGAEERIQPDVGTLSSDRGIPMLNPVYFACLDLGDDGTWDQSPIETFPVFGSATMWQFPDSWIVSLPTGRTRVAIAYFAQVTPAPTCTAAGSIIGTTRFLVTRAADGTISGGATVAAGAVTEMEHHAGSAARRPPARAYRARARMRLLGGRLVSNGSFDAGAFTWTGMVSAGRFRFPAPARGAGARRPAALALFTSGTFASRSQTTIGSAPRLRAPAIAMGTTTMLVRGAGGALGCFRIIRAAERTTWTFTGGTGAARRLEATLTGPPTTLKSMKSLDRRGVLRPLSATYSVSASTRTAPRRLPTDCASLRGRLRSAG